MVDVLITIPKKVTWEIWLKECEDVAKNPDATLNYRVARMPKGITSGKTKCFVVYDGFIRGYHEVHDVTCRDGFTCHTTGKEWKAGYYLIRKGSFHPIEPIPHKGFQGWRYFNEGHRVIRREVDKNVYTDDYLR